MYRPTIRMSDEYKEWIDSLFHSTSLDRNQLLRLAIFVSSHDKRFYEILQGYKTNNLPLPPPKWESTNFSFFLDQQGVLQVGERDVTQKSEQSEGGQKVRTSREIEQPSSPSVFVPGGRIKMKGGIKFTL